MIHHEGDRHKQAGTSVVCSRCGLSGGTLVKIGDGKYVCQDQRKCGLLQSRGTLLRKGGNR